MAVKTYSNKKDGSKFLSKHFQVSEFRAIGNGKLYTDTVKIDEDLVKYLESIFTKLKAKLCIISSGYRNAACDKAVGGSGSGQHVNGRAADCCYYDKNGKIIPSKIVVCVAYDLKQFNGVAKIDKKYVHLDTRTSGKYRGDESKGTANYWTNPYDYFKVTKEDVAKYTGETVKVETKPVTENVSVVEIKAVEEQKQEDSINTLEQPKTSEIEQKNTDTIEIDKNGFLRLCEAIWEWLKNIFQKKN